MYFQRGWYFFEGAQTVISVMKIVECQSICIMRVANLIEVLADVQIKLTICSCSKRVSRCRVYFVKNIFVVRKNILVLVISSCISRR